MAVILSTTFAEICAKKELLGCYNGIKLNQAHMHSLIEVMQATGMMQGSLGLVAVWRDVGLEFEALVCDDADLGKCLRMMQQRGGEIAFLPVILNSIIPPSPSLISSLRSSTVTSTVKYHNGESQTIRPSRGDDW